jgi:hypothetical protein
VNRLAASFRQLDADPAGFVNAGKIFRHRSLSLQKQQGAFHEALRLQSVARRWPAFVLRQRNHRGGRGRRGRDA